jgi:HEAT repeat protein
VPDLIKAINCGDPFREREAPLALAAIGPAAAPAVPALIGKLKEEDYDAAWFSADALGQIGEPALVAIPALEIAAQSKWEPMARHAKAALKKLRKLQNDLNKK